MSILDRKNVRWTVLALCGAIYIAQLACVVANAVNVPFWDEWEAFYNGGILVNQTLSQLFAQHNEHRIVTTKLLTLILYYTDGWNIATHQTVNFLLYGILVTTVVLVVRKGVPEIPFTVLLCFTIFLLSDISWENHSWGFQSQFHFALLFLFFALWCLFDEDQSWKMVLAGSFFLVLGIYSFSIGITESVVVLAGYFAFKITRNFTDETRQGDLRQLALVGIVVLGSIGLYFVGYSKPESAPYTLPYQKLFWTYLLNLLSGGVGYKVDNILPGTIIFFFSIIPIIGLFKQHGYSMSSRRWMIVVTALSILASVVTITMGRAINGKGHSKASRYSEITIMLVPVCVAMWWLFLQDRRKLVGYLLAGFWVLCGFGLLGSWNFPDRYADVRSQRLQARECIQNYYLNGGPADCPTAYPRPLAERLDYAKGLPLSFLQELQK